MSDEVYLLRKVIEAADKRLAAEQAQNKRYREALNTVVNNLEIAKTLNDADWVESAFEIAQAALKDKE